MPWSGRHSCGSSAIVGSAFLTRLLQAPFVLNGPIVNLALHFSAAVDIVFGYIPALKAARLYPIEVRCFQASISTGNFLAETTRLGL